MKALFRNAQFLLFFSAMVSGVLFCFAFPRLYLGWISYFALVPFLSVFFAQKPSIKTAFFAGGFFSFFLLLYIHSWMLSLGHWTSLWILLSIWVLFSLYQSIFYGVSFALIAFLGYRKWMLPVLIVVMEVLRSLGPIGSTGGVLGMTQVSVLPMLQWASLGQVWGLSVLVVCINLLVLWVIQARSIRIFFVAVGVFLCFFGGGFFLLQRSAAYTLDHKQLVLIQGNHSQEAKLDATQVDSVIKTYTSMTAHALRDHSPDLIVWPETVLPYLNLEDQVWMRQLVQLFQGHDATLVFGTPIKQNNHYYNGMVTLTQNGVSTEWYLKRKLMPFGEYWPFRYWLARLGLSGVIGEDYSVGEGKETFRAAGVHWGGLICLESLFPSFCLQRRAQGAEAMIVLSNSGWFGHSIASDLHWDMAIMRAVETGRPIIQCANTGYSGLIDAQGRVRAKSNLGERQVIVL